MENQLKILIYDRKEEFIFTPQNTVTQNFRVYYVLDFENPSTINFEEYDEVIFIINDLIEVLDLLLLYPKSKSVHVTTNLYGLAKFFSKIKQIHFTEGIVNLEETMNSIKSKNKPVHDLKHSNIKTLQHE